ncbi:GntR family transcriptional regulator [Anaerobacillus sp. MEB173]|uniref:GntR family transcriptional regulator n=1 Tax=Anaerobacillus sp. MEB173 TaxID=3383345 RepID=UPI003F90E084
MRKIGKFISYTDQVYKELKEAVISGKINPGDFLQERGIAEELGVSRTPVREALKKLEYEGWVETIPWKGVIVKDIELQDVIEVFQCRYANERYVVELVTEKIEDKHVEDLVVIHEKMKALQSVDRVAFINEDREFHMYLAKLTNNNRLINFLDYLSDQIIRLGIRAVENKERVAETLEEHEAILQALQERSVEKAVKAIEEHIENSQKVLLSIIEKTVKS